MQMKSNSYLFLRQFNIFCHLSQTKFESVFTQNKYQNWQKKRMKLNLKFFHFSQIRLRDRFYFWNLKSISIKFHFHLGSISPICLWAAFTHADPRSVKKINIIMTVFLCFWDLRLKKLLVKRWWNKHLQDQHWSFTPDGEGSWAHQTKCKAYDHDINRFQLDGSKNGQASHNSKGAPIYSSDVGSFRFWEVELTFNRKCCDVKAIGDLQSSIKEVEYA